MTVIQVNQMVIATNKRGLTMYVDSLYICDGHVQQYCREGCGFDLSYLTIWRNKIGLVGFRKEGGRGCGFNSPY